MHYKISGLLVDYAQDSQLQQSTYVSHSHSQFDVSTRSLLFTASWNWDDENQQANEVAIVPGQVSAEPPPIQPPAPPVVQEQDVEMSIVPGQVAAEPPPIQPPPPPSLHVMQEQDVEMTFLPNQVLSEPSAPDNATHTPSPAVQQAGQAPDRYSDLCQHYDQVSALPTCHHLSYTCSRWPKH